MFKVIIQKTFSQFASELLKDIAEVELLEHPNEQDLVQRIKDIDALVGRFEITEKVLGAAESLKIIALHGHGVSEEEMKWIDVATRRGIFVIRTPGAQAESVAEHAFAMILVLARKLLLADREVRRGNWKFGEQLYCKIYDVAGKTIGIIGLGK